VEPEGLANADRLLTLEGNRNRAAMAACVFLRLRKAKYI